MALTNAKELASTLVQLIEMERDPVEYWRSQALEYWRKYLRNQATIDTLRRQNRILRRFLSDIIPPDLVDELDRRTKAPETASNSDFRRSQLPRANRSRPVVPPDSARPAVRSSTGLWCVCTDCFGVFPVGPKNCSYSPLSIWSSSNRPCENVDNYAK